AGRRVDEGLGVGLVLAGQGDDERLLVGLVVAQGLGDLHGLVAAHGVIDDDRVGLELVGLAAGLEAGVGDGVLVVVVLGQLLAQALDEGRLCADDEDLVPALLFEAAQGHAVVFQEADQVVAGDAAVLAAGDPVAFQLARIEPLADRPRRDLTD